MNLYLRIDINIVSAILLGFVLYIAYKRLDRKDSLNRTYFIVSFIIIIQLLIETGTCIINKLPYPGLIPVTVILHILLFSIAPILSYYWYILIRSVIINDKPNFRKNDIILAIPVAINLILTLLSPIYKFVFYVDSSNTYIRGRFFPLYMAITYFYVIFTFLMILANRRKIAKHEFLPLTAFSFLPIIGGIVQSVFYGALLMWSSNAFTLIIVYIFLQQRMVQLDALTGAWNRSSFDYYINQRLKKKKVDNFGVIYIDADGLKEINDEFGHSEGDFALKTLVAVIKKSIRKEDIVVRMGGDEFIVILDRSDKEFLNETVKAIEMSLVEYNKSSCKCFKVDCSFGADIYDSDYNSIELFLNHVDNLMYNNKRRKKQLKES